MTGVLEIFKNQCKLENLLNDLNRNNSTYVINSLLQFLDETLLNIIRDYPGINTKKSLFDYEHNGVSLREITSWRKSLETELTRIHTRQGQKPRAIATRTITD